MAFCLHVCHSPFYNSVAVMGTVLEESKNLVFRKLCYCILTCLAIPWGTSTEACLCFGPLEPEQFPGWCLSKCLNLLAISHKFSEATGYKINTQKSIVFLCTSNEQWKQKIKKTIPLTIASKSMKYLKINLTKEASLVQWKYKLLKEMKEYLSQWEDVSWSWIGRLLILLRW